MADKAPFEFTDVQGIVRFGHGRLASACFLLLKIRDVDAARSCLSGLPVTSAEKNTPLPERALQVAFTAQGLQHLDVSPALVEEFSDEFLTGMVSENRSRRLGDTQQSAPQHWDWGKPDGNVPDVLLMFYALPGNLQGWMQEIMGESFHAAFTVQGELPCNEQVDREPFGFADGISQPHIDWEKKQTADIHRRDSYSNLLALGEVLLGYPNEYGEYTRRPLVAASDEAAVLPEAEEKPGYRDLGRNGSYLVLRQLEQDVSGFWQFVDARAGEQSEERKRLAAAMVGRKRSGEPLVPISEQDIEGTPEKLRARNNFNFEHDAHGIQCPIASHVRRSNPRTGDFPPGRMGILTRLQRILGFDKAHRDQDLVASTRFHRILRRGRPYGPALSPEQAMAGEASEPMGLQFVCLSSNIARQFEFVQNAWIANAKFAGLQDEEDPLLGSKQPLHNGSRTDNFSRPGASGPRRCMHGLPAFVRVRGGAYFFLPGIRALSFLCSPASRQEGVG